jgi:hypothetical protein
LEIAIVKANSMGRHAVLLVKTGGHVELVNLRVDSPFLVHDLNIMAYMLEVWGEDTPASLILEVTLREDITVIYIVTLRIKWIYL